jgi:hypothetical protein
LQPLRDAKRLKCSLDFVVHDVVTLASTFFSATGFSATGEEHEPLEQEDFLPKIPSADTDETATTVASRNENIAPSSMKKCWVNPSGNPKRRFG